MNHGQDHITDSFERKILIDLAVEGWRFARVFSKILSRVDTDEVVRYSNQLRFFLKKVEDGLESIGIRLVSLEGQLYDPGMALSALNIADFGPDEVLIVEQMIEPVIIGPEGLVRGGTAMLAKAVKS